MLLQELDAEIQRLKSENADVQNQSVLILEENESRLQNIKEQEAVSSRFSCTIHNLNLLSSRQQIRYHCFSVNGIFGSAALVLVVLYAACLLM